MIQISEDLATQNIFKYKGKQGITSVSCTTSFQKTADWGKAAFSSY